MFLTFTSCAENAQNQPRSMLGHPQNVTVRKIVGMTVRPSYVEEGRYVGYVHFQTPLHFISTLGRLEFSIRSSLVQH